MPSTTTTVAPARCPARRSPPHRRRRPRPWRRRRPTPAPERGPDSRGDAGRPYTSLPCASSSPEQAGRSVPASSKPSPATTCSPSPATRVDLADREQVEQVVAEFGPDAIVNAAAMTNVDACERDPERAFAVNALGVRTLAQATARRGAHLVHISTDYVFDGDRRPGPTTSGTRCIRSPSTGARSSAARSRSAAHARSWAIVRTSWVFGRRGTDLVSWAFGAFDRGELDGVLADQVSIPTYAPDLAELLARFAVERRQGLFHVTSGDGGGDPPRADRAPRCAPVGSTRAGWRRSMPPTSTGPRPGRRCSVLDNRALRLAGLPGLRPWRDASTGRYAERYPVGRRPAPGAQASTSMSDVAVIGAGYVGLTTAACLAHLGHSRDLRRHRRGTRPRPLGRARCRSSRRACRRWSPRASARGGSASWSARPTAARDAEFVFLCVPTPQSDDRRRRPLVRRGGRPGDRARAPAGRGRGQQVDDAGRFDATGGAGARPRPAPPTTSAWRRTPSSSARATRSRDFLQPSRVVIGCDDAAVAVRVSDLYREREGADPRHRPGVGGDDQVRVERVPRHQDLVHQRDRQPVRGGRTPTCARSSLGMGYDQRIGFEFLHPGPGYGGSCFPKDTAALLYTAENAGYDFSLLRGVVEVNQSPARAHGREAARRRRRLAARA